MKTKHIISGLAALVFLTLTMSNCKKESGTGSGMNMKVKATSPTYNIPVQEGGSATVIATKPMVRWDMARMVVSRLNFEAEMLASTGEPREVEFSWIGPKTVDLINMTATLGNIPLPPGQYTEIEFTIYANKSDAGKDPVFYLSGTYNNSRGLVAPLIIDISDDIKIKAEEEKATMTVNSTTPLSGIFQVYLDRLFTSILPEDLNLSTGVDGKIIISRTSNPDLYALILKNLGNGGDWEIGHDD